MCPVKTFQLSCLLSVKMSSFQYLLRFNSLSSSWTLSILRTSCVCRQSSLFRYFSADRTGGDTEPVKTPAPPQSQSQPQPPPKTMSSPSTSVSSGSTSGQSTLPLPPQQKLNVLNLNINYQQVGNGPMPVLCLPGALGFIESDFGPLLHKFDGSKFTVVVWDPPGYGKSRPLDRNFKDGILNMYISDAVVSHALMQKLGFKTFSIVGWSDGGITALLQAAKFPKSIDKMVTFGGNAFISEHDANMSLKIRNIDTWSDKMKAPMLEMYGEKYFRKLWTQWVDATVAHFRKDGDLCSNQIGNITCPTLVIHGLKDPMVERSHAEFIHQKIKHSKLHLMPEGRHNLHLRLADEFIPLVESFLLNPHTHAQTDS